MKDFPRMCSSSINYYNENADTFYSRTINIDMGEAHQKFLNYIPTSARILDAGCGIGRDAQAFYTLGHEVIAFDASIEMVKKSSELLSYPTLHLSFSEMDFTHEFDGIWANASLLHVSYEETLNIFRKIHRALKPNGIFYASYKYGCEKMVVGARTFYNMNEVLITEYLDGLFDLVEIWQTAAHTSNTQPDHNWLNILSKKI